jgi:hypothetical protein
VPSYPIGVRNRHIAIFSASTESAVEGIYRAETTVVCTSFSESRGDHSILFCRGVDFRKQPATWRETCEERPAVKVGCPKKKVLCHEFLLRINLPARAKEFSYVDSD